MWTDFAGLWSPTPEWEGNKQKNIQKKSLAATPIQFSYIWLMKIFQLLIMRI
jgi:hypothetical protein